MQNYLEDLRKKGFVRAEVDGKILLLDSDIALDKGKNIRSG